MRQIDAALQALLAAEEWRLVGRLAAPDRAHLLEVHRRLVAAGCRDVDVLTAALLHDVGKADERGRVGLTQRVVVVLLAGLPSPILHRMARPSNRPWLHGLYLAQAHPALGSAAARSVGCTPRVCRLIALHHDFGANEPGLGWLRLADEGS